MPFLFTGPVGRVYRLADSDGNRLDQAEQASFVPLAQFDGDDKLSFQDHRSIIVRATMSLETSQQFLHTFGGDVYVYVFGDRIGQMTVGGMSFANDCAAGSGQHGAEKMLDWYNANKVSQRKSPLSIILGRKKRLQGYLVGYNTTVNDFRALIVEYSLTLALLPPRR